MSGERILVVDDEHQFRRSLVRALRGHAYEVWESETAAEALEDFGEFNPDVVLLDLMLPDGDGIEVCRNLREHSSVSIIVLSVIGSEQRKVEAFDNGADDYLTKPFGSDELLARIRAALRRSVTSGANPVVETGPLRIDLENQQVFVEGREVRLTPTEFALLQLFTENAGRIIRHEVILRSVWGDEYMRDTQILRTYIKQLRSKLNDDSIQPRFIRTEPGLGYRFMQPKA